MRTFRLPENDLHEARSAARALVENLSVVIGTRFHEFDDSEYRKHVEEDLARLGRAMGGMFLAGLPLTNANTTNSQRSERGLSADDRADMERDDRMNEKAA